jgi:hypothetical protein
MKKKEMIMKIMMMMMFSILMSPTQEALPPSAPLLIPASSRDVPILSPQVRMTDALV